MCCVSFKKIYLADDFRNMLQNCIDVFRSGILLVWIVLAFAVCGASLRQPGPICNVDDPYSHMCPSDHYYDSVTKCCLHCWGLCTDNRMLKTECNVKCRDYAEKLRKLEQTSPDNKRLSDQRTQIPEKNSDNNVKWHIALEVILVLALLVTVAILLYSFKSYRTLAKKFKQYVMNKQSSRSVELSLVSGDLNRQQREHSDSGINSLLVNSNEITAQIGSSCSQQPEVSLSEETCQKTPLTGEM